MQPHDIWSSTDDTSGTADLMGYSVEAPNGSLSRIDAATNEVGTRDIGVDTGPWIFDNKVLLPAGVMDAVDFEDFSQPAGHGLEV